MSSPPQASLLAWRAPKSIPEQAEADAVAYYERRRQRSLEVGLAYLRPCKKVGAGRCSRVEAWQSQVYDAIERDPDSLPEGITAYLPGGWKQGSLLLFDNVGLAAGKGSDDNVG